MRTRRFLRLSLDIALLIAILVSVWLSVLMWLNPAHYESNVQRSSNNTANKSNLNVKPIQSVYLPTQLVQNINGQTNLLINPSVNMINEIQSSWKNYHDFKIDNWGQKSSNQILKLLQRNQSLILSYNSPVTLSIFAKLFDTKVQSQDQNKQINRIVLPTDKTDEMYLLNDDTHQVYRLRFKNSQPKMLGKIIDDKRISRDEMYFSRLHGNFLLEAKHRLSMPQYSYLMDNQAQNYYILRLLGDSQNFNVKRHKHFTTYNDQSARQVSFYANGNINYLDDQPNSFPSNFNQFLYQNYDHLLNSGIDLNNIHFFDYDNKNKRYDYRMYVEGFPIFSNNNEGLFRISLTNDSSLQIKFSLNSLQIPTPNDNKRYNLPTTHEVFNNLNAHGIKDSQIQHIEIGYRWKSDTSSKLVVNLVPEWYLKIGNQWYGYSDLLAKG